MFAVIEIRQYYEEINYVKSIGAFAEEQKAYDFIKEVLDKRSLLMQARMKYVDNFVEGIELPNLLEGKGYVEWCEFLKQFHPLALGYIHPKDFKKELKFYLIRGSDLKLEGYNPPEADFSYKTWHVVEVNE